MSTDRDKELCLGCRQVRRDDDPCPRHGVAGALPMAGAGARERFYDYTSDALTTRMAQASASISTVGVGFIAWRASGALFGSPENSFAISLLIGGLLAAGTGLAFTLLTPVRGKPLGRSEPDRPDGPTIGGTVRADAALEAPATGTPCAGYTVDVRAPTASVGSHMLSESRNTDLTVDLDDGRQLRIAAGCDAAVASAQPDRARDRQTSRYIRTLNLRPERYLRTTYFTELTEHRLVDGDRVEVVGELVPMAITDEPDAGFRDSATPVVKPAGAVLLRATGEPRRPS